MAYYKCQCKNIFKDEPYEKKHICPACQKDGAVRIKKPVVVHNGDDSIEGRFKIHVKRF